MTNLWLVHTHMMKSQMQKKQRKSRHDAEAAKEEYAAEMKKKGATLPKGFIKDAKANTGH